MPDTPLPEPIAGIERLQKRLTKTLSIGAETERAYELLVDASIIARDVADEPDWTHETAPPKAKQIVLEAARRAFNNPDGLLTQRLGDASWGWHHGTLPGVYLTDEEARRLRGGSMRSATLVTPYSGIPEDELPL